MLRTDSVCVFVCRHGGIVHVVEGAEAIKGNELVAGLQRGGNADIFGRFLGAVFQGWLTESACLWRRAMVELYSWPDQVNVLAHMSRHRVVVAAYKKNINGETFNHGLHQITNRTAGRQMDGSRRDTPS